jgi:catechol 2,3-dioxygenase-like lactoylglutathione lyase family enzyme
MSTIAFDHVALSVGDLDQQAAFYEAALGLTEVDERVEMPEAQIRTVILRGRNGMKIELVQRGGSTPQEFDDPFDGAGTQSYFHFALNVDDLDVAFKAMLAAGAEAVSSPAPAVRAGARFAYVKDPEGNLIEIIQPAD